MLEAHHHRIRRCEPFNQRAAVVIPLKGTRDIVVEEGLHSFAIQPGLGKYTGIVTIYPDVTASRSFCSPNLDGSGYSYRFALKLQDRSFLFLQVQGNNYVEVIVRNSVAQRILEIPASEARTRNLDELDELYREKFIDTVKWKVTIQSVEHSGKRYFVAENLSRIIPTSI